MSYLSNLNRKKIFRYNWMIVAFVILTISSILIIQNEKTNYLYSGRIEISDGTEYRYLLENEVIDENKVKETLEKYEDRTFPQDFRHIDIKDYFIMRNITQIYGMELEDTGQSFFQRRQEIMKVQNEKLIPENMVSFVMGYAEGWKIITDNFYMQIYALWAILMFIFLPIYNEDRRFKMEGLIAATEFGSDRLNRIRIRNVYEIISGLYLGAVVIYLLFIFMMYGIEGYDLMIQNSPKYLLSPMDMNYLTAFLYQLLIGFIVTCFVGNIFLWLSKFIEDVKMGYAFIMGIVALDYGFRYLMLSKGLNFIPTLSPIVALNMGNILFSENIMNIPSITVRLLIYIFVVTISTFSLSKIKMGEK